MKLDIYLIGVGGQGIGLLSEALLRAADRAGLTALGVDTHGLAQRGGTVVSHVRLGPAAHSPLIMPGQADLVIALERHEALRGLLSHGRPGGTLVYCDTSWQPLAVRLGREAEATAEEIAAAAAQRRIRVVAVDPAGLAEPRLQNVRLLAELCHQQLVPGVRPQHYVAALTDLLQGEALAANLELFHRYLC